MWRRVAVLAAVLAMTLAPSTLATEATPLVATAAVEIPTASVVADAAVVATQPETALNVTDGFTGLSASAAANESLVVEALSHTTKVVASRTPTPKPSNATANSTANSTSASASASTSTSGSGSGEVTLVPTPRPHHHESDSSSSGSGYGYGSSDNSSSGSVSVGDVGYTDPVTYTALPETTAPAQTSTPIGSSATDADANAQRAKDISGGSNNLFSAAAFVGFAGCAAIAVAAVYTRARGHSEDEDAPENPFEHSAPESIELRRTSSGVYNDPLGTRFSSIVMITPNGEGVCIL